MVSVLAEDHEVLVSNPDSRPLTETPPDIRLQVIEEVKDITRIVLRIRNVKRIICF